MRTTWRLPQQRFLALREWTEQEVLLEFNGPQLVIYDCGDLSYLSVASDFDADRVRWLRSRISDTEREALLLGATTVRECILKPEIVVVDTDNTGKSLAEVVVGEDILHEDDLPSIRSLLPEDIVSAHRTAVAQPSFVLNGPSIVAHSVGFRVLADVSQQIQRLWNAIGQTILGTATAKGSVSSDVLSATEIRLLALQPGSIGLQVTVPNEQLFSEIATSYGRLLSASGDPEALQELLHTLKARVRSAFSDYLSVVQRHNIEILARWRDNAVFVSPSTATRISSSLEYVGGEEEERFVVKGFFIGFNIRDATFEFQDALDETRYEGRVSPRVIGNPELQIVIGPSALYEVEFTLFTWSAAGGPSKQLFTLENVSVAYEKTHSE